MQPVSLPLLDHPFHGPGWDWKGPSPSCAVLWRNHYFTNSFSVGFAGWEDHVGLSLIPCGGSTLPFPFALGELIIRAPHAHTQN